MDNERQIGNQLRRMNNQMRGRTNSNRPPPSPEQLQRQQQNMLSRLNRKVAGSQRTSGAPGVQQPRGMIGRAMAGARNNGQRGAEMANQNARAAAERQQRAAMAPNALPSTSATPGGSRRVAPTPNRPSSTQQMEDSYNRMRTTQQQLTAREDMQSQLRRLR